MAHKPTCTYHSYLSTKIGKGYSYWQYRYKVWILVLVYTSSLPVRLLVPVRMVEVSLRYLYWQDIISLTVRPYDRQSSGYVAMTKVGIY